MRGKTSIVFSAVAATLMSALALPAAQAPSTAARERDPFTPPIAGSNVRAGLRRVRPVETRLSDVALDGAALIGVACSQARQAAVLRSASGRAWAIAAGDRLRDSRVARVTCDAVLFERVSPKHGENGPGSPEPREEGRSGDARTTGEVWRSLGARPVSPKPSEGGKETR